MLHYTTLERIDKYKHSSLLGPFVGDEENEIEDCDSSSLYYKHATIVNDNSSVISKWSFKFIDDSRVVIYDCHKLIIQATDSFPAC